MRQEQDKNTYVEKLIPSVDIYESKDEYVLKADMPGINKENINITFEDDVLDIEGVKIHMEDDKEVHDYKYARRFQVSSNVDSNNISASVDKGILTLTLPKKEDAKPKKIDITAVH